MVDNKTRMNIIQLIYSILGDAMSTRSTEAEQISLLDMEWQGVTLTGDAARRIRQLCSEGSCFHLSVRSSGCTGFAYQVQLIESPCDDDVRFLSHDVEFYVGLNAMPMIDGTEIDYVRQGLNSSFVYNNPNVKNMCGCGESFGV